MNLDIYRNDFVLNPLVTIFNASSFSTKSYSLKRKISELYLSPTTSFVKPDTNTPNLISKPSGNMTPNLISKTSCDKIHCRKRRRIDDASLEEYILEENAKRRNYEYLLAKYYTTINDEKLAEINLELSKNFYERASQVFKWHCTNVFDDISPICNRLIKSMWSKMSLRRKFPFYWVSAELPQLSKNAFENFVNYCRTLPYFTTHPIDLQKLLYDWKFMSYDDKLPFIFEAYLVHMSSSSKLLRESNTDLFFEEERIKCLNSVEK